MNIVHQYMVINELSVFLAIYGQSQSLVAIRSGSVRADSFDPGWPDHPLRVTCTSGTLSASPCHAIALPCHRSAGRQTRLELPQAGREAPHHPLDCGAGRPAYPSRLSL